MAIIADGTVLEDLDIGGTEVTKVYAREGETGTYVLVFEKSSGPVLWFVGNWKMNQTKALITQFFTDLAANLETNSKKHIWICPPACYLKYTVDAIPTALKGRVEVGVQNICTTEIQAGAYTGQISAAMAKDCGCSFVLVGQQEVRQDMGVTIAQTKNQIAAAEAEGLKVVFCVKSTDELASISPLVSSSNRFYVVYEPDFDGSTPTPSSVASNLTTFKNYLTTTYSLDFANQGYYLYSGSIKTSNVNTYLQQVDDLNGLVVPGGSLYGANFANIINTASKS